MNKTSPTLVQGFTLIEMTVVLLLITLLASVAIRETNSLSFQVRYEQTQERLERIREAILGNPRQIINGQQAISGFVADMGRLPVDLHELLEQNFCSDRTYSTQATCEAAVKIWKTQPSWQIDAATGLGFGWRGPYLNISGNAVDKDAFVDGWGRMAQGYCSNIIYTNEVACVAPAVWTSPANDNNYGWYYKITNNDLLVQSYGKDHVSGGSDYDADYPAPASQPEVRSQNWLVDISGGIRINLLKKYGTDSYCGFSSSGTYASERDCSNAGGAWSGSCALTVSSCKSVGGHWQSCFFSPSACASAGGTSTNQCQFTEKSCNTADGDSSTSEWVTNQCTVLSNATACANAGGSWNVSQCSFTPQQCSNAGGAWVNDCTFTSANCTEAGGTWENTTTPNSCSFTQAACHAQNGQSTGSDCYMSHAEFSGAKYVAEGCQTASGLWTARLCMNLFYRDPDTSAITSVPSLPITIDENGGYQTVQFSIADANDIDKDENTAEPMPYLPVGSNAIGIYEYDGDCDPVNNLLYPADRQNPILVDFHPRTGLPVINW